MAQLYYSPISVSAAQVPSTQTDFPMLVSVTDARFKSVANSGHVAGNNGFDIRPYTDGTLATPVIGYYLHRYNASTGEVIMRVKVSSLSSSTTPFVLGYGDSSLNTDASSSTTFSNSYKSFYGLSDGTTLSLTDAVGAFPGTNHGATAGVGQVDGCAAVASASSQYISTGDQRSAAMSMSCWVNGTTFPGTNNTTWCMNVSAVSQYFVLYVKSTGKLACFVFANVDRSYDGTGSHTLSTGTWYHLAMSYDSSAGLVGYVNGASDNTVAANGAIAITNVVRSSIGTNDNSASQVNFWNGSIDEVRVATVARSANWFATEYNNEVTPATFETLGTEVSLSPFTGLFRL